MVPFETEPGSAHPVGVTTYPSGVNFSLFSQAATEMELLLFEHPLDIEPAQIVRLDPFRNKTFHFWHVFVRGCGPGMAYAFRIDGPANPAEGHRFNPNKVLISPYARGIHKQLWKRAEAIGPDDNIAASMRCAVVDSSDYNWEGDRRLKRAIHESIIYEMHVGGFTRSPTAGVRHPGTFAALVEKIPYLQALGISAMTYHRWRKAWSSPGLGRARREPGPELPRSATDLPQSAVEELREENRRLRQLVTDLSLEKLNLQEMVRTLKRH